MYVVECIFVDTNCIFVAELQLQTCFDILSVRYLYIVLAFYAYLIRDIIYMAKELKASKGRCWWLMTGLGYLHSVVGPYVDMYQEDYVLFIMKLFTKLCSLPSFNFISKSVVHSFKEDVLYNTTKFLNRHLRILSVHYFKDF